MTTPVLDPADLRPGSWMVTAQVALDRLGACATVNDVADSFGSVRQLAVEALGYPTSGGHATKPVIRALGELLQHRLGPAVATEALTYVAAIFDLLDSDTVRHVFHQCGQAESAYRPPSLEYARCALGDELAEASVGSQREQLAGVILRHRCRSDGDEDGGLDPFGHFEEELAAWLSSRSQGHESDTPFRESDWFKWRAAFRNDEPWATAERGVTVVDSLTQAQVRQALASLHLFTFPAPVLGVLLRRDVVGFLAHRDCPPGLADRIRHPYDRATLELALAAPSEMVSDLRLDLMLGALGEAEIRDLADSCGEVVADRLARLRRWTQLRALLARRDEVGIAAAARIPGSELLADDAVHLEALASERLAECPGVPAIKRPLRSCCNLVLPSHCRIQRERPFVYPPLLVEAVDRLRIDGWQADLPVDVADLEANGDAMHNCTGSYASAIARGLTAIIVLQSPDGETYNAQVSLRNRNWVLGEVAGRFNDRYVPREVVDRLMQGLSADPRLALDVEEPPLRRGRKLRRRDGGGINTPWHKLRPG